MRRIFILAVLVSPALASEYSFKKQVNSAALRQELFAADIKISKLECRSDKCVLSNPSKDPSAVVAAHVYRDPFVVLTENREAATRLFLKLKAGKATEAEKDELLERLAFILVGQ